MFIFAIETGVLHVGQAGLELLTSGDLLASNSQIAGNTGVSHCTLPPPAILVFFLFFSFRWNLAVSPRVECSGSICAYCSIHVLGSSTSLASASQVARIPSLCHHARVVFIFLVETGFCHIGLAALEALTSCDLSACAYQIAGITGMNHHASPFFFEKGSHAVTQAGVQGCDLGLLSPPHCGLKQSSCFGPQSSWDYRCVPP